MTRTYRVEVAAWLPENEHQYGGTPEYTDELIIPAFDSECAEFTARAVFQKQHPDADVIEASVLSEEEA